MVVGLCLTKPMKNYIFKEAMNGTQKLQPPLNNAPQAKGTSATGAK